MGCKEWKEIYENLEKNTTSFSLPLVPSNSPAAPSAVKGA
jgi:hypothetical protein